MITPQDAEKRTREIVAEYIRECGCKTPNHIRLVLTKLISMVRAGYCGDQRKGGCPAGTGEHTHPHGRA